jgi:hypothetical protein
MKAKQFRSTSPANYSTSLKHATLYHRCFYRRFGYDGQCQPDSLSLSFWMYVNPVSLVIPT